MTLRSAYAAFPLVLSLTLATLALIPTTSAANQSTSISLFAIDANPSGNGPRSVGSVESCVEGKAGQPVDIDIALPAPGIPADRGITAYQFSLLYDPSIVWIEADDNNMLLAQAPGSNVIPIADPKPDRNGVYQSWGVDFGTRGIEPTGGSEIGPGVIARVTLLPQRNGISTLTLSDVIVTDDAERRIPLDSVQSASLHVGERCAQSADESEPQGPTAAPTDTPPAPAIETEPDQPSNETEPSDSLAAPQGQDPEPIVVAGVPNGGGPPPPEKASAWWLISGLAALGAASLLLTAANRFGRERTVSTSAGNKQSGTP